MWKCGSVDTLHHDVGIDVQRLNQALIHAATLQWNFEIRCRLWMTDVTSIALNITTSCTSSWMGSSFGKDANSKIRNQWYSDPALEDISHRVSSWCPLCTHSMWTFCRLIFLLQFVRWWRLVDLFLCCPKLEAHASRRRVCINTKQYFPIIIWKLLPVVGDCKQ